MNIPEILPCPNPECDPADYTDEDDFGLFETTWPITGGKEWHVECDCGYQGPRADTSVEAIRLHNAICRPLQPPGVFTTSDVSALLNRRQPTPEAANKVANLPAYWRGVADMKGAKDSERFDRALRCCAADLEDALKSSHPPKPEPTEARWKAIHDNDCPKFRDFFDKHALEVPLGIRSCFVCGKDMKGEKPAIQHMELPGIVCCASCAPKPPAEWMAEAAKEIQRWTYGQDGITDTEAETEEFSPSKDRAELVEIIAKYFPKVPEGEA